MYKEKRSYIGSILRVFLCLRLCVYGRSVYATATC